VHQLKISVITVSYNTQSTIKRCIQSVIDQDYDNVEHIIIDGQSKDNTLQIIKENINHIKILVSEPDSGIYDAMNKGIALATGDIIGTLNADDYLADKTVFSNIAEAFARSNADVVYGDIDYVDQGGKIIRKWRSGKYKKGMFNYGWMPPHPTFYCKREMFFSLGNYSLEFGTAADYELMLRFMHLNKASVYYLQKVLIKMTNGGISNKNYLSRIRALYFDFKAMYNNNILFPPMALLFKPLRKLKQFF